MARITVEDCIDKFESRFELVLVASNRARKLHSGESPTVEKDNDKPTVVALREIADESISVDTLKETIQLVDGNRYFEIFSNDLTYNGGKASIKDEVVERLNQSDEDLSDNS